MKYWSHVHLAFIQLADKKHQRAITTIFLNMAIFSSLRVVGTGTSQKQHVQENPKDYQLDSGRANTVTLHSDIHSEYFSTIFWSMWTCIIVRRNQSCTNCCSVIVSQWEEGFLLKLLSCHSNTWKDVQVNTIAERKANSQL